MILNNIPYGKESYFVAGLLGSLVIEKGANRYCYRNMPGRSGWYKLEYGQDRFLGEKEDWTEVDEQKMTSLLEAVKEGFA